MANNGTNRLPTGMSQSGYTPLDSVQKILDDLGMQLLQQTIPNVVCECTAN